MYNPQLDTFIRVAEAGSFSKAAQSLFITPTAVIKQMNLLESRLGLRLGRIFNRSRPRRAAAELCAQIPLCALQAFPPEAQFAQHHHQNRRSFTNIQITRQRPQKKRPSQSPNWEQKLAHT